MSKIECPHCGTFASKGKLVCTGCKAEIVYGSTNMEKKSFSIGFAFLTIFFGKIIGFQPFSSFESFFTLGGIGVVIGLLVAYLRWGNMTRFFRKMHNY